MVSILESAKCLLSVAIIIYVEDKTKPIFRNHTSGVLERQKEF